jgi:hexokinase
VIQRTVLPSTPYDVQVDQASNNQGLQAFEKLTAEMYLGDITHNVIDSLIQRSPPLLLNGVSTPILDMPGGFIA